MQYIVKPYRCTDGIGPREPGGTRKEGQDLYDSGQLVSRAVLHLFRT